MAHFCSPFAPTTSPRADGPHRARRSGTLVRRLGGGHVGPRWQMGSRWRVVCRMSASHPDDLALVRRALAGETSARERLAQRLGYVGRYAQALNREGHFGLDPDALRDATQNAVAKVLAKLGDFRGEAAFETWACAFVRGEFLNAVRARKRQREQFEAKLPPDAPAADPAPVEALAARELPLAVSRCLDLLPPADQELLREHLGNEVGFAELAAQAASTLDRIKNRYYRALGLVRRCLGLPPRGGEGDLS